MGSLSGGLLSIQHTQDSERLSQLAILASPKKLSPCQTSWDHVTLWTQHPLVASWPVANPGTRQS